MGVVKKKPYTRYVFLLQVVTFVTFIILSERRSKSERIFAEMHRKTGDSRRSPATLELSNTFIENDLLFCAFSIFSVI